MPFAGERITPFSPSRAARMRAPARRGALALDCFAAAWGRFRAGNPPVLVEHPHEIH